jgi:hypothetical protein
MEQPHPPTGTFFPRGEEVRRTRQPSVGLVLKGSRKSRHSPLSPWGEGQGEGAAAS